MRPLWLFELSDESSEVEIIEDDVACEEWLVRNPLADVEAFVVLETRLLSLRGQCNQCLTKKEVETFEGSTDLMEVGAEATNLRLEAEVVSDSTLPVLSEPEISSEK